MRGKINWNEQRLIAYSENMPIDILRVRMMIFRGCSRAGVVDLGIIGENILRRRTLDVCPAGKNVQYKMLKRLEFWWLSPFHCSSSRYAIQRGSRFSRRLHATSYPHLLKRYMQEEGVFLKKLFAHGFR